MLDKRWFSWAMVKDESLEAKELEIRAKVTSEVVVSNYFEELREAMEKYDLTNKPHLIFNVDKKGISQDHTQPHVI